MLGIIGIKHHCIQCIIGCLPSERLKEQPIYVDVKVKADFSKCVRSCDVNDTISYVRIAELCTELAQEKKFFLLEELASAILDKLSHELNIKWSWVCVKKPAAIPTAEYSLVELERHA